MHCSPDSSVPRNWHTGKVVNCSKFAYSPVHRGFIKTVRLRNFFNKEMKNTGFKHSWHPLYNFFCFIFLVNVTNTVFLAAVLICVLSICWLSPPVHGWAAVAGGELEVLHPHGGHPLHHPPHLHRAIRSQVCGRLCGRGGVAIGSLSQCFGSGFIESWSVSGSSILG